MQSPSAPMAAMFVLRIPRAAIQAVHRSITGLLHSFSIGQPVRLRYGKNT
jgi:hypothetical protein